MTLQPGNLLTPAQALKLLPIGRSTLHRLLSSGALQGLLVRSTGAKRGRWLVSRRSLEDFIAKGLAEQGATRPPEVLDADQVVAGRIHPLSTASRRQA